MISTNKMTNKQLLDLREEIEREIFSRGCQLAETEEVGEYIVGEAILKEDLYLIFDTIRVVSDEFCLATKEDVKKQLEDFIRKMPLDEYCEQVLRKGTKFVKVFDPEYNTYEWYSVDSEIEIYEPSEKWVEKNLHQFTKRTDKEPFVM